MGVGRCCCKEAPIVWRSFCRAWNSVVNQEFDNLVALSGVMPTGTVRTNPNASLNNPQDWSYFVETQKGGNTVLNYSVQPKNPGIEMKILGLQNQQLVRVNAAYQVSQRLLTFVNFKNENAVNSPSPESRYNNEPSYPAKWLTNGNQAFVPNSLRPVFEFKINLRNMSPSVESDRTVLPQNSGYQSSTSIDILMDSGSIGFQSLQYFSTTDPGSNPQRTVNVWYFGFFADIVQDAAGNNITATFPCEIKFVDEGEVVNGNRKRMHLYIDGVKTNKSTVWYKHRCTLFSKKSLLWWTNREPVCKFNIFAPAGRKGDYGQTYPNFTTPDQVINVESFEYKIGNGHEEYLTPINWQINNGNNGWSYDSSTKIIAANNSGSFRPFGYLRERYAYANLNLKANSHYKIEWLNTPTDGVSDQRYHPFIIVNNFELSDAGSYANRYKESLFFNTNSSGQTLLKFIGYYNRNYDISDIKIWLVYEPLNIVYPVPFTNDGTAPATNVDWRLVNGGATITPTIGGGKEPYTVAVQAGSLPPGCTLDLTNGVITLNAAHSQATHEIGQVTIRVTDLVGSEFDAVYVWERLA